MPHVWWHCELVGDQVGTTNVKEFKVGEKGTFYFDWKPPHDMPKAQQEMCDAMLQQLMETGAQMVARWTGSKVTGDPSRHEEVGLPPLNPP